MTIASPLTMNSTTLANRIIRNIDYQLQDLATGNVGGQIYLNGTNLNILNNVNSGAINLYTKDSSGASTIPLKITSTQITSTERLFLTGTTDLDRIINNVYYQFQDKNALATTTGQIYANSGSMIYDNNAYSGIHTFAVDDAVGNQVTPLSLNSAGLQVGTGLTLNMGTGSITNATAMTATTFNGALNGNASTATTATNSNITLTNLGSNQVVPLINTAVAVAGSYSLSMATAYPQNLLFNNSTGNLTCQSIISTLTGTSTGIKDGLEGELLYQSGPSVTAKLPIIGTNTYVLTSNGSVPLWAAPAVPATPTLAQVLVAGNTAGATDLDMNGNDISNVLTLGTTGTITCGGSLTMNNATLASRQITNVSYNLTDLASGSTAGVIYANNGVFVYDNNSTSGSHNFTVSNAVPTQVTPLILSSSGLQVGTGLTLNMGTGSVTNATAMTATTFNGALNGNSSTTTSATGVFINGGSASPGYLLFANSTGGTDAVRGNVSLTYNTGSATLTATNITASTTLISPLIQNVASGAAGITIRNQNGNSGDVLIQNSSTSAGADIILNTTILGQGVISFQPQNTVALTLGAGTIIPRSAINYANNGATALSGSPNFLTTPFISEFYLVNAAAIVTITLPDPDILSTGMRITFRRSAGTATITVTTASGGSSVVPHNSITAGVNATMLNTVWTSTFFCNGTLWYQASY